MSVHDEHIGRGIELLDETVPGWEQRVDLSKLDLGSCTQCVVGQLFDIRDNDLLWQGYAAIGLQEPPTLYGFALDDDLGYRATYGGLTTAWKRAIRSRRRAASSTGVKP